MVLFPCREGETDVTDRQCTHPAEFRFTWPGQDESFICEHHVGKLRSTANAMGMHLQVIQLSEDEIREMPETCRQKVRD